MRGCCCALWASLPPEAERWLFVADSYRAGLAPESELMAARLAAWDHLGDQACDFASPTVNAMRVVLFLLFPDDDPDSEDVGFLISHFLDFCTGAGMSTEQQYQCLADAYGLCSGDQTDA